MIYINKTFNFDQQMDEVPSTIRKLADGKLSWSDVTAKWPKFEAQENIC